MKSLQRGGSLVGRLAFMLLRGRRWNPHRPGPRSPAAPRPRRFLSAAQGVCAPAGAQRAGQASAGGARAPAGGGWFSAHMFLCLAGPRALFAQQHVVPLEEIEPALKVQGTAKLCWEAAGPGPGCGGEPGAAAPVSLSFSEREGVGWGARANAVWNKRDHVFLAPAHTGEGFRR